MNHIKQLYRPYHTILTTENLNASPSTHIHNATLKAVSEAHVIDSDCRYPAYT